MHIVGHGIDIVEIERISAMLDEHGEAFLRRCFTAGECAYADATPRRRVERYAVRFAAKEAGMKSLGTGWRDGIAWTDFEVRSQPSGQPKLVVTGRSAQIAAEMGIEQWHISLSHTTDHGFASVLACGR
jgi:holo-[acyl-carrier protein] synthase